MRRLLLVLCAATALAACAPKAEKTVAAIDPRTPPAGMTVPPQTPDQAPSRAPR